MAERAHVARELHDILAHSLSALAVSLERTRLQAQVSGADPAVVEQLAEAHQVAGRGLVEARRAVGALRGDLALSPTALHDLVAAFSATTGMLCRTSVAAAPTDLPAPVHLAMYRALQESLSNIARHAASSWVRVQVDYPAGHACLTVEDGRELPAPSSGAPTGASRPRDPDAPPPTANGSASRPGGLGLLGISERVELLGGWCSAGPTTSGWTVRMDLPR